MIAPSKNADWLAQVEEEALEPDLLPVPAGPAGICALETEAMAR